MWFTVGDFVLCASLLLKRVCQSFESQELSIVRLQKWWNQVNGSYLEVHFKDLINLKLNGVLIKGALVIDFALSM